MKIINGVKLTDAALNQLRYLQEEDNSLLKSNIEELHKIAHPFVEDVSALTSKERLKQKLDAISTIFAICEQFEALFATEEGGTEL